MIRTLTCFMLLAAPAWAQDDSMVIPCDESARADTIVEPWDENSATYADGAIRVAILDMVEPAAAAIRLLVISPPLDELGIRQCRIVGLQDGLGLAAIDFAARQSSYDPQRGLTLSMPARMPLPDGDADDGWFQLGVTIDQQTGKITTQGFK